MLGQPSDEADYWLFTLPGANMHLQLQPMDQGRPELQLFGNREAILSLANILLWLACHSWRRDFLSLGQLPFMRLEGTVAVCIRLEGHGPTPTFGRLVRTDHGEQLEWIIDEDDLQRLGLVIHDLASTPEHEYDILQVDSASEAAVHIRMSDAGDWIQRTES
jgi:hypothetical protein